MATHETGLKWVAQIAAPRTDPAFDRTHPDFREAAARYMRLRTAKALDAVPLVPGRKPRLWGLRTLDTTTIAALRDLPGQTQRSMMVFLACCHVRRDPDGMPVEARVEGKPPRAKEAWVEEAMRLGGLVLVEEIAEVALRREELGDYEDTDESESPDDPFARYSLPRGLALPR